MYKTVDALIRMLAPILAHTAEEAWGEMKHRPEDVESVHLAAMVQTDPTVDWQADQPKWDRLFALRDEVLKTLEVLRQGKEIASNQEASVIVRGTDQDIDEIGAFGLAHFAALCIVSDVRIEKGPDPTRATANKSPYAKCQRCWNYGPTVDCDSRRPGLCRRCIEVLAGPGQGH